MNPNTQPGPPRRKRNPWALVLVGLLLLTEGAVEAVSISGYAGRSEHSDGLTSMVARVFGKWAAAVGLVCLGAAVTVVGVWKLWKARSHSR